MSGLGPRDRTDGLYFQIGATRVFCRFLPGHYCSECGEHQVDTASGIVCRNGHGGCASLFNSRVNDADCRCSYHSYGRYRAAEYRRHHP